MLAIKVIVKYKGIILPENSHQYVTQFWLTEDSTALVAIPVCGQS